MPPSRPRETTMKSCMRMNKYELKKLARVSGKTKMTKRELCEKIFKSKSPLRKFFSGFKKLTLG